MLIYHNNLGSSRLIMEKKLHHFWEIIKVYLTSQKYTIIIS